MPAFRRFRLLAVVLAGAGLLAACSPAAEAPDASPSSSSPATTASPSPSEASPSAPAADASATGILGVELGAAFDEAVAASGAMPEEACADVATTGETPYRLQLSGGTVDTVAVTVPVGNAAEGAVGPRTDAGIGIGSTVDEARAAYPDAQEVGAPDAPVRFLEIDSDPQGGTLYLLTSDGAPVIWGLVATTLPEPRSELCG
jgi:hypothetical protein